MNTILSKLMSTSFNRTKYSTTKLFSLLALLLMLGMNGVKAQFTAGNIAVLAAAASSTNTTASVIEINKTSTSQSAITTTNISATGTDAIEVSGSASSTMYASNSNDGTLFCFTGHNSTASGNVNAIATRAVVTLNGSATFTKQTTYTAGTSGGTQTRGASTLDNTNWYIGDQQGFYTNGGNATNGSPTTNTRSIKAFGGTVYGFTSSATAPPVFTISGTSSTSYTNLTGLGNGATTRQDFYLISSGSNGSTFDVLYISDASAAATGTIYKYSLVSGSWTANGTYSTSVGGFGIIAEKSGSGANIYITTGSGATTANSVRKIVDGAGYNTTINVTGTSTLYTAGTGVILKGLAFAPNKETLGSLNSASTNHVIASPLTGNNATQPIFGFSLTSEGTATLSSLALTVSRSISTSDISNVKLWSSTTNDYNTGTLAQVGSTVASPSGTSINFSSLSKTISNGSSNYFFITCDVANGVTGSTSAMQISLANSGITATGANVTGGTITGINYSFTSGSTPTISGAATATAFTTTYGTASSVQTFSISGANLTADITATAPAGFEVSSDGTTYGGTATFTQSGGTASGSLRIRLKANAAVTGNNYNSQTIALTSTNATTVNITTASTGNTVSTKALNITGLIGQNKNYDGTTTATVTGTAAYNGLVNSESFSVSTSGTVSWAFPSSAVGSNYTLTQTNTYTVPSSNYSITQPTITASINVVQLTAPTITGITGANGSLSVSFTAPSNASSTGSAISNYKYSINGGSSFTAFSPAQTTSPLSITSGVANDTTYDVQILAINTYGDGLASSTFQGTPVATPTINATASLTAFTTTYGTASSAQNFAVAGSFLTSNITATAPSGYEVSSATATYAQTSGNASGTLYVRLAANAAVTGTYNSLNIVFTSTGATTVNVSTATSGNTVSTKGLIITGLSATDKNYDGNTSVSVIGTPTYSGLANGETFLVVGSPTWAFTSKTAGSSKAITQTGNYSAPSSNYSITQPTLTANINTIALTISGAAVTSKSYDGGTTAAITGSLTGVISPDVVSLTGTGIFASANVGTAIAVTSTSTIGGADAANYTLTQPTGLTGDITKANQTITFGALAAKTTTDVDYAPGATASSTLTVSYASSNASVATIVSGQIHIVGAGTTTITASQAGDANYNAATSVNQSLTVTAPDLVEVIFPQYIQGVNGTNSNRIPFAYRATLNNLTANATYRYINGVELTSASATSVGAGNCIFPDPSVSNAFVYSTGPSLSTSGNYGSFTTDNNGSYTGWFIIAPTGNATRFVPGTSLYTRISLNDGAGGTSSQKVLSSTNTITVINLVNSAGSNNGTGLWGRSSATNKNFVFAYDNTNGTGRPLSGTFVESDGATETASFAAFYTSNVDGVSNAFGMVIPNTNANGVKRIEFKNFSDNSLQYAVTDADGNWGGSVNTVNPTGGTTALVIPQTFDDMTVNSNITLSAATTVAGTLTINSSKILSIGASNTLTLNGSVSGSGFISGSSTSNISISGASGTLYFDQTTPGTTNVLKNLAITGTGTTTLGNALNIAGGTNFGVVTVGSSATLASAGNLTLKSTATGTAAIGTSAGTITGNITIERFISQSGRRWRYISAPVTGQTLADWGTKFYITGPGTPGATVGSQNSNGYATTRSNLLGFNNGAGTPSSVRIYNRTTSGSIENGWANPASNMATTLTPGVGYRAFIRGPITGNYATDTAVIGYFDVNGAAPTQSSFTFTQTGGVSNGVNAGSVSMPINSTGTDAAGAFNTSNDGWNLLGNPYPCAYDWKSFWAAGTNRTNIGTAIYAYDATADSYKSYSTASSAGSLTSGIIPSGSAFFVQATGTGASLTLTEAFKTTSSAPIALHKKGAVSDELHIKYYKDSTESDEYILKMIDGATLQKDDYDITKLKNDNLNLSSYGNDSINLTLSSIPFVTEETKISLNVEATRKGTYNFDFNTINDFDNSITVSLLDKFTQKTIDIRKNPIYTFVMDSMPHQWGKDRFVLILNAVSTTTGIDIESNITNTKMLVYPNPASDVLNISINNTSFKNSIISIFNISGNEVLNSIMNGASTQLNIESLSNGVYFVKVKNENGFDRTVKFIK